MTDDSKKQCQIGLRKILNTHLTFFLIFTSKIIIDLRFTARVVSFSLDFFGLSIPSKMSVSEIKTTFFVFNSRRILGQNIKTNKLIKYRNYHRMSYVKIIHLDNQRQFPIPIIMVFMVKFGFQCTVLKYKLHYK